MISDKIKKGLATAYQKTGGAAQAAYLVKRSTDEAGAIVVEMIPLLNAIARDVSETKSSGGSGNRPGIFAADLKLTIDGDQAVKVGDHVTVSGRRFIVGQVDEKAPAGLRLLSVLHLKRI